MNIIFRVDSSAEIGSGHVMRCIALAEKLKENASIIFVSRALENNINYIVKEYGFELVELPYSAPKTNTWLKVTQEEDAKDFLKIIDEYNNEVLVIVDHYYIGEEWERIVKGRISKLIVVDDFPNRKHNCDLLIDTSTDNPYDKYAGLLNAGGKIIWGRKYQFFRDEFIELRKCTKVRCRNVQKVLISFGGSDPTGETLKILDAITDVKYQKIKFYVVVGACNKDAIEIKSRIKGYGNIEFLYQITDMAARLNDVDLVIGASGVSLWERVFMRVASFCVSVADNQENEDMKKNDLPYVFLGSANNISSIDYKKALDWAINNPEEIDAIYQRTLNIFDDYTNNIDVLKQHILEMS